ncbi:MAG TPA: hypothetical protein VFN71_02505 [Methylomirabilota bacterium]|nr:hypothetical protein [Methylomirabilota bacterium]
MISPRASSGPSPSVPLRYLVTAAAAFLLAALGVPWLAPELAGHYYHPRVLALVHTLTLGWITLSILGASFQLIPIILQRPIWSERLARWQYWLLTLSVAGMVGHFYLGTWPGLVAAAALLGVGLAAHMLNVALSLRGFAGWTFTTRLIALAYGGLIATVALGLALGANHVWPFLPGEFFPTLHAHFHLALLGWVAPMVMGVAARVYPMFLLAPEPEDWTARVQFWGLLAGVPTVVAGLLGLDALIIPGALAVAVAAMGHAVGVSAMARDRRRPALDWGLRFVLTGTAFLLVCTALGLGFALDLLSGPRLGLGYAIVALGGWVSLTIAGMMLKIVPFLVWYRVYSPRAGRAPVPTLGQLSWPAAEATAYTLLTGGITVLAVAAALGHIPSIRVAGIALAAGALAFAAALGRVLHHLTPWSTRGSTAAPGQLVTR